MVIHNKFAGGLQGLLERLIDVSKEKGLLVGIPSEKTNRPDGTINNAELLYIHTHGIRHKSMRDEMSAAINGGEKYSNAFQMYVMAHGSPLWQSPPRPVIEPAIEHNKKAISEQYGKVVKAGTTGNAAEVDKAITRCGELTVGYCREWFTNPANGWPPNTESTIKAKGSDRPLIDTGNLRKSITWVVR